MGKEDRKRKKDVAIVRHGPIKNRPPTEVFIYMEKYKLILKKYLPENSVDTIYEWLQEYKVNLKVSKKRSSKLGDYRSPYKGKGHQITVNHDLNSYAFLITLVHEIAHLVNWENHKNRVRAHGVEWKNAYRELMSPLLEADIFPDDIKAVLINYMAKSYASSGSDLALSRVLQKYDEVQETTLESLPEGVVFILPNGKRFKKGALIRTRYKCFCLDNKRTYLVNPLAAVEQISTEG